MRNVFVIVFIVYGFCLNAQAPSRFYTKFGDGGDDIGYSVKQTLDGQYIVAGSTSSFGNTDVYLLKIDSMGLLIWRKNIGGINNDVGKSVVQLPDSGYVVAGFTNSYGAGGYDAYLIRTDKNGNVVWEKTFGGTDWDFAYDLVLTSSGNIAVVGTTSSFGSGQKDGMVLIFDYSGNLILQKFHGGTEDDELKSIITTSDGFLATVGYTNSKNDVNGDAYFLKLDLNGDTIFTRTFGNPGKGYLNDLIQFPSGDYIVVGAETYTNLPFTQSYRAFINSLANVFIWEGNSFTSDDDENWNSVTKSIAGSLRTSTLRDFYKVAFKKQGNIFSNSWDYYYPTIVNDFGGEEDEHLYCHEGTRDGGFICVGSTRSYNSLGEDVFIIKLDSSIINYSQIVGVKNDETFYRSPIIKIKENVVQIVSQKNNIPESIELVNIYGEVLLRINNISEIVEFDKTSLINSFYIIKFNYSNGYCLKTKILI